MTRKKSGIRAHKETVRREKQSRQRLLWGGVVVVVLLALAAFAMQQQPVSSGGTASDAPRTAPEVGALAPDFELISYEGDPVSLSDFRGQPVAVMFMHTW